MESAKKVVVFGASGNVGIPTVRAAANAGYEVTAFVRDWTKLPSDISVARVVESDVYNRADVLHAVEGQHGVIIALGTRSDLGPTTVMSDGTKIILEAMKACHVKRVSCCISSFLFWDKEKVPERYKHVTEDHERMLEALKASDREWVAVLPPHISDEPARGTYIIKNDAAVGRIISKYDLAEILVKCLCSDVHIGHAVGIGYP